jgi:hypothetical protein
MAKKTRYRVVVIGRTLLLGGRKVHTSSWFASKATAKEWAWAARNINEAAGRKIESITYEVG